MYLHEYQAKAKLADFGVPVAPFSVASSVDEVEKIIAGGVVEAVVKIQVHAGGRGKAGGVKLAKNPQEIRDAAKKLLGMRLVNNQTGPEGVVSEKIIIDSLVSFSSEFYLGIILDRARASACVIASKEGGMEIEEIAATSPDKIFVEQVPATGKLHLYQLLRLAKNLGWTGAYKEAGILLIKQVVEAFFALDATLIEINPLVQTSSGFIALDAKVSIDDNALFRQKELQSMWDPSQQSVAEQKAHEHELAYVALDGNIGCMVNGAGLAMATMDLIRYWGGSPANFLDVGGSATLEKVIEAFKILFLDPSVQAVLVNIFGGIMNCEIIAQALIQAIQEVAYKGHVVVRMEGTNVEKARALLTKSGLHITPKDSLDDAAREVCQLVKGV
ncbi:MAG: ADP-forming succinate--CoA ligase subunit beta [Chlamydiales bacterium]|nr:ADP-forming succinate--CoA ligase subunit beta [Chlamydiales bacterium]